MKNLYRLLCPWLDPAKVAKKLANEWGEAGMIWLDGDGSELGRWVTIGVDPIEEICCRGLPSENSASNPFKYLRNLSPGHWTGWLSYEAGAWIEPKNPWKTSSMATLWIASHDPILKFDLKKHELWIEGFDKKRLHHFKDFINKISQEEYQEYLKLECTISKNIEKIPLNSWKWMTNNDEFSQGVNYLKKLIHQGDIFQANLTACCQTTIPKNITNLEIFNRLRTYNPAPFSGLVIASGQANGEAVISSSPERFLQVLPTGEVETRPIKGTRPRHPNPQRDAELAAELVSSSKDRAENIMIVDILRNDLGRVCRPGSIYVSQLVGLESFSQVHHLTSIIKGNLKANKTWVDLLESAWPGGSITGAPKTRACKRLFELEPTARGPYCGSLINIQWNGTFDSNILIRSLMIKGSNLKAHAGCGIVADSEASRETEELNWKLMPLLKALT